MYVQYNLTINVCAHTITTMYVYACAYTVTTCTYVYKIQSALNSNFEKKSKGVHTYVLNKRLLQNDQETKAISAYMYIQNHMYSIHTEPSSDTGDLSYDTERVRFHFALN